MVARLETTSAASENPTEKEKLRGALAVGMNEAKYLHVIVKRKMSIRSSHVAEKVRGGEVKCKTIVELGAAFV